MLIISPLKAVFRTHLWTVATTLALMPLSLTLSADTEQTRDDPGQLLIPELGAIIVATDDGPRVTEVSPIEGRLEKYRNVDLQSGDLVLAANGQRIESLQVLRGLVGSLAAGEEIRMAVQRFKTLKVVKFCIATDAERRQATTVAADYTEVKTQAASTGAAGCGPRVKVIGGDGAVPCVGLGVMLDDSDGHIVVTRVIELPPQLAPPVELGEGDVIASLQDTSMTGAAHLVAQYDQIPVGAQVRLAVLRNNSETELTFVKPAPAAGCVKVRR